MHESNLIELIIKGISENVELEIIFFPLLKNGSYFL